MQVTLEFLDGLAGAVILCPLAKGPVCGLEQLGRLLREDRRDLLVVVRFFRLRRGELGL